LLSHREYRFDAIILPGRLTKVALLIDDSAVWLDDYFQWLNPALDQCCRVKIVDPTIFCSADDSDFQCRPCFEDRPWNITMEGLPIDQDFMRYLKQWLISPSDESCPLGGRAAYSSALDLSADGTAVELSHFRTYHTPLKSQSDFIEAHAAAQRIALDISAR
jgi:Niemann-Pick C1 protein